MRHTLITRILSQNEQVLIDCFITADFPSQLCITTLKLFEALIGLYNQDLMYNLIFRTLVPRYHLQPPKGTEVSYVPYEVQATIARSVDIAHELLIL